MIEVRGMSRCAMRMPSIKIKMKGVKKGVSISHDNVHDSTGGWDVKGVSVM